MTEEVDLRPLGWHPQPHLHSPRPAQPVAQLGPTQHTQLGLGQLDLAATIWSCWPRHGFVSPGRIQMPLELVPPAWASGASCRRPDNDFWPMEMIEFKHQVTAIGVTGNKSSTSNLQYDIYHIPSYTHLQTAAAFCCSHIMFHSSLKCAIATHWPIHPHLFFLQDFAQFITDVVLQIHRISRRGRRCRGAGNCWGAAGRRLPAGSRGRGALGPRLHVGAVTAGNTGAQSDGRQLGRSVSALTAWGPGHAEWNLNISKQVWGFRGVPKSLESICWPGRQTTSVIWQWGLLPRAPTYLFTLCDPHAKVWPRARMNPPKIGWTSGYGSSY